MKLPGVTKAEKRQLKKWLTSVMPEGMSRNDIADELDVTRKTISAMLNPNSASFANGLTMLRYLQLVGAVTEAPTESPASSRLAAIEAAVANLPTQEDLQRGLEALRAAIDVQANRGSQPGGSAEAGTA